MQELHEEIVTLDQVGMDLSTLHPGFPAALPADLPDGPETRVAARRLAGQLDAMGVDLVRAAATWVRLGGLPGIVARQQPQTTVQERFLETAMRAAMAAGAEELRTTLRHQGDNSFVVPAVTRVREEMARVFDHWVSDAWDQTTRSRDILRRSLDERSVVRRYCARELPRGPLPGELGQRLSPQLQRRLWARYVRVRAAGYGGTDFEVEQASGQDIRAAFQLWDTRLDAAADHALTEPLRLLAVPHVARLCDNAWTRRGTPQRSQEDRVLAVAYYPGAYHDVPFLYVAPVPAVVARVCVGRHRRHYKAYDLGPSSRPVTATEMGTMVRLRQDTGPLAHWDTVLQVCRDTQA